MSPELRNCRGKGADEALSPLEVGAPLRPSEAFKVGSIEAAAPRTSASESRRPPMQATTRRAVFLAFHKGRTSTPSDLEDAPRAPPHPGLSQAP